MASFHYRAGKITAFFNTGEMRTVSKTDHAFEAVKSLFEKQAKGAKVSDEEVLALFDTKLSVETYSKGKVRVVGNEVFYGDKPIHGMVAVRINEYMQEGLPIDSLVKFIENVMKNPSFNSRQEAFDFVDRCNLPLTEDGCFIGYKGVRRDLYDKYSGTILNSIGAVVQKDRGDVDDNTRKLCSYGLHVGSYDYATSYAGDGVVLLVKVNPANVVSVANDACQAKIRVCEYTVINVMEVKLENKAYKVEDTDVNAVMGAWSERDEDDWDTDEDDDDDYEDEWEEEEFSDEDELDEKEISQLGRNSCQSGGCGCKNPVDNAPVTEATSYHNLRDKSGRFAPKKK